MNILTKKSNLSRVSSTRRFLNCYTEHLSIPGKSNTQFSTWTRHWMIVHLELHPYAMNNYKDCIVVKYQEADINFLHRFHNSVIVFSYQSDIVNMIKQCLTGSIRENPHDRILLIIVDPYTMDRSFIVNIMMDLPADCLIDVIEMRSERDQIGLKFNLFVYK